MYLPAHFAQTDPAALRALMHEHPLAVLVTHGAAGLTADHLPLEWVPGNAADGADGHGLLRGHVARANPLWRDAAGTEVMAVFRGPQAYVTPSWYPSKAQTHKVVPTWNYTVVHVHGTLAAVDDAPWLRQLVGQLTDTREAGRAAPWSVDDAPPDYVLQMLRAIVGIEIRITRLVGKWKISQNRSEADRRGVADGLAAEPSADAATMAAWLRGAATPTRGS